MRNMAQPIKKRWIILFIIASIVIAFEIISAPLEWIWPGQWGGSTYWSGVTDRKQVALTFDDGPSRYTEKILDILLEYKIPATFFVMGRQAELFPETVKRMAAENHEIGNHTYSFVSRRNIFFSGIQQSEIYKTQNIVQTLVSKTPRYYRSPGGQLGRLHWIYVRSQDLDVVFGAVPFPHPDKRAAEQLEISISNIKPGAILLLHDGDDAEPDSDRPQATVALLPELVREIHDGGYEVVSLGKLLEDQGN
jgi:peptidoglycan/xylan/chitin deacetylase (PgdA/CDA1 family)